MFGTRSIAAHLHDVLAMAILLALLVALQVGFLRRVGPHSINLIAAAEGIRAGR